MTRTNATTRSGSSRARRGLMILPVVLALGLAPVAPALATGGTNNGLRQTGGQTPTPNSGTSPSKSTKTPDDTGQNSSNPRPRAAAPTTTTSPAKASTLPFTGFDLRWTVAVDCC